jgi:hypothetical protein
MAYSLDVEGLGRLSMHSLCTAFNIVQVRKRRLGAARLLDSHLDTYMRIGTAVWDETHTVLDIRVAEKKGALRTSYTGSTTRAVEIVD